MVFNSLSMRDFRCFFEKGVKMISKDCLLLHAAVLIKQHGWFVHVSFSSSQNLSANPTPTLVLLASILSSRSRLGASLLSSL